MTRVDAILAAIDTGLQTAGDTAYGDDWPGTCWRCGEAAEDLCAGCREWLHAEVVAEVEPSKASRMRAARSTPPSAGYASSVSSRVGGSCSARRRSASTSPGTGRSLWGPCGEWTCSTRARTQPWICYHYGLTHDGYWPFWTSTRFLGRSKIRMECCVCGKQEIAAMRIPRWGPVPEPESGRHPLREKFLAEHAHPDRGAPMSWVRPLRNMAVFGSEGMPLDALAIRLEADLNDEGSVG